MKFLLDKQLPFRLASRLRKLGHFVEHVEDLGLGQADDAVVWNYAGLHGSVMVSKDEDFTFLVLRPGDSGRLVWVKVGNMGNAALVARVEATLPDIIEAFARGERMVEVNP